MRSKGKTKILRYQQKSPETFKKIFLGARYNCYLFQLVLRIFLNSDFFRIWKTHFLHSQYRISLLWTKAGKRNSAQYIRRKFPRKIRQIIPCSKSSVRQSSMWKILRRAQIKFYHVIWHQITSNDKDNLSWLKMLFNLVLFNPEVDREILLGTV